MNDSMPPHTRGPDNPEDTEFSEKPKKPEKTPPKVIFGGVLVGGLVLFACYLIDRW